MKEEKDGWRGRWMNEGGEGWMKEEKDGWRGRWMNEGGEGWMKGKMDERRMDEGDDVWEEDV